MKVFHVITSLDLGGAERVALNIAKSKSEGFEYHLVEVVKARGIFSEKFVDEAKSNAVILHKSYIPSKKIAILLFWFRFLFLMFRFRPNIIHAHTEVPDLSVYIWYKLFGWLFPNVKLLRTIHNTELWSDWKRIGRKVEQMYKSCDSNIAVSIGTKQRYIEEYGDSLVKVIYNGVEECAQKKFQDVVPGKINVLFAGRLEYQKGVDEMIQVFKNLANDERYQLFVVGTGSMKEKVDRELSAFHNIKIYDKIYGISQYLGSFDYFFMPSNFEGFGLMCVEASLAHVPTIINKCMGLDETLPENWPLSVKNNDVNDYLLLFHKTLLFADNYQLNELAYSYAKQKFSLKRMQKEYETFYQINEN